MLVAIQLAVMEGVHNKPADIVPPSPTASIEVSSEPSPSVKGAGEASPDSAVAELKSRLKRQERKHAEVRPFNCHKLREILLVDC